MRSRSQLGGEPVEEILRIAKSISVMLITTGLFCWLLIAELDFNLILAFVSFAIGLPLISILGMASME